MWCMSNLTVRIPRELEGKLKRLCNREHRTTSEVVRESLRQYIVREELRQLRERLRPYAEAAGLLTDGDIFKAVS